MTDAARRGRAGSPAGRDLVWFRHAEGSGPLAYPEHLGEIGGMARRAAENLASDLPSEGRGCEFESLMGTPVFNHLGYAVGVTWLNGKHMAGTSLADEWFASRRSRIGSLADEHLYTKPTSGGCEPFGVPGGGPRNLMSIKAFVDA
jgi:hypothetical protein